MNVNIISQKLKRTRFENRLTNEHRMSDFWTSGRKSGEFGKNYSSFFESGIQVGANRL
jgi:hypothetical protein